METLSIRYTSLQREKNMAIFCATFLLIVCLYVAIDELLKDSYALYFFIGVFGVIISLLTLFTFSWWQPGALLTIDNNSILVNLPKMKNRIIEWNSIKNIAIGGGHLKITTDSTLYLDLGSIKQIDINQIKSKIVEICDTKGIPFHND